MKIIPLQMTVFLHVCVLSCVWLSLRGPDWVSVDCSLPGSSVHGISKVKEYWSGVPFDTSLPPKEKTFVKIHLMSFYAHKNVNIRRFIILFHLGLWLHSYNQNFFVYSLVMFWPLMFVSLTVVHTVLEFNCMP